MFRAVADPDRELRGVGVACPASLHSLHVNFCISYVTAKKVIIVTLKWMLKATMMKSKKLRGSRKHQRYGIYLGSF